MTDERDIPTGRAATTTLWATVLSAAAGRGEALQDLISAHWRPVYLLYRGMGVKTDEAGDLTQAFFASVLEKGTLAAADPERGRFRSFLKTAARNFLLDEWERARAQKRGGGARPLDFAEAEKFVEAVDDPAKAFDRQWAVELLQSCVSRLESELGGPLFEAVRRAFALDGPPETPTHARIASELSIPEQDVANFLFRARRRLREILRERVRASVLSESEVDGEIRDLFEALGS